MRIIMVKLNILFHKAEYLYDKILNSPFGSNLNTIYTLTVAGQQIQLH